MVFAAEFTTAALVLWAVLGLGVGFVIGWLVRPWLVADRLREEYEALLEARDVALATSNDELAAATAALETATTDLEAAEADRVRLQAELAAASSRAEELAGSLETTRLEKDAEIERLTAAAAKVSPLEQRVAELETAARDDETDDLRRELAALRDDMARLRDELESCRRVLAVRDETIAELRAATRVPAAAPAPMPPATETAPTAPPPVAMPDRAVATRRVAEIAQRTRGDDPRVDDDLERVHGIGPKIAGMLREMGITSFRQIARFEPDDIGYVAAALESFPDRIERDDWIGSAASLHREKYGEPA